MDDENIINATYKVCLCDTSKKVNKVKDFLTSLGCNIKRCMWGGLDGCAFFYINMEKSKYDEIYPQIQENIIWSDTN